MVSPATAKTHVSRMLTKLGLRDRAQLVVAAYESGLVVPGRPTDVRLQADAVGRQAYARGAPARPTRGPPLRRTLDPERRRDLRIERER